MHDAVTGLPNSSLLQQRLQHSLAYAKRYSASPALLLINLNGSADLAGIVGQRAEDDLLRTVAKRLLTFKRESDTLARFEGHEFALLLENVSSREAAETILTRAKALMAAPFAIKNMEISVQAELKLHLYKENLEKLLGSMKQIA
jgi:diguanylate cyclase (GGDEF)-like protein